MQGQPFWRATICRLFSINGGNLLELWITYDGATETMQNFAIKCLKEIYVKELELNNLLESFNLPAGDDVTEDDLKSTQFADAIQKAQENATHL